MKKWCWLISPLLFINCTVSCTTYYVSDSYVVPCYLFMNMHSKDLGSSDIVIKNGLGREHKKVTPYYMEIHTAVTFFVGGRKDFEEWDRRRLSIEEYFASRGINWCGYCGGK